LIRSQSPRDFLKLSFKQLKGDAMKSSTIAAGLGLLAGAALFEVALVPGLLIGAAVVLAPKSMIRGRRARRRRTQTFAPLVQPSKPAAKAASPSTALAPVATPARYDVKKAIFKTITFRVIATSFDFAANMVVIGDFTTAAGLSAFGLVGAPLFYFCHELFWNRLAQADTTVDVRSILRWKEAAPLVGGRRLKIDRALAKTITYEIVTAVVDFSANYIATGDVVAAAGLTAFAVVISPVLFYGHEKVWDYFGANGSSAGLSDPRPRLLPMPIKPAALSFSPAG
jgi:uncharacterized membrane protein